MKQSQPRNKTIDKYELYLKSLIIKIKKYHNTFDSQKFLREGNLPNGFLMHCEYLGYITRTGNGKSDIYKAILNESEVTKFHGRRLAERSLRYNINHSNYYKDAEEPHCVVGGEEKCTKLKEATLDQIQEELKKRGYISYLKRL